MPRINIPAESKAFSAGKQIDLNYEPKTGLSVFEVMPGATHAGTEINNLVDVSGKSTQEIFDAAKSFDPRVVTDGIPDAVAKEIKAGNISHVFTTDPTTSGGFTNLSDAAQENVRNNTKGSVYFRTKEGKTARWKLPEISSSDSGWNANKGLDIFSDQTVYLKSGDGYSLAKADATVKQVQKGVLAAEDVDPRLLSGSFLDDILAGKEQTIGQDHYTAGAATAPSTKTPVKVGKQAENVSNSVPSRTNSPVAASTRSASTTADAASSGRPTIPFKKIVDDTPVLGKGNVSVAGTQAGSTKATARISTSGAKVAAEDAAEQAAKQAAGHAAQSSGRAIDHNVSKLVASGVKDSKNLRIAGAAAILGIGTLAMRGRAKSSDEHERSLLMQRQGIYR